MAERLAEEQTTLSRLRIFSLFWAKPLGKTGEIARDSARKQSFEAGRVTS